MRRPVPAYPGRPGLEAAMGVEDDFGGIAARTFSLMRARMIAADADNELFEEDVGHCGQEGASSSALHGHHRLVAGERGGGGG